MEETPQITYPEQLLNPTGFRRNWERFKIIHDLPAYLELNDEIMTDIIILRTRTLEDGSLSFARIATIAYLVNGYSYKYIAEVCDKTRKSINSIVTQTINRIVRHLRTPSPTSPLQRANEEKTISQKVKLVHILRFLNLDAFNVPLTLNMIKEAIYELPETTPRQKSWIYLRLFERLTSKEIRDRPTQYRYDPVTTDTIIQVIAKNSAFMRRLENYIREKYGGK